MRWRDLEWTKSFTLLMRVSTEASSKPNDDIVRADGCQVLKETWFEQLVGIENERIPRKLEKQCFGKPT